MKRNRFLLLLIGIFSLFGGRICAFGTENEVPSVIPKPSVMHIKEGKGYVLSPESVIYFEKGLSAQAEYFREAVHRSTGYDLKIVERAGKKMPASKGVSLMRDTLSVLVPEGYMLDVDARRAVIGCRDAAGAFYGLQTLLQLFPEEIYSSHIKDGVCWEAQPVHIEDAPERPWRGMMLDVARYFFDKEFVKKYIDMMAMYKLNKLQFHFIDDSGWRLEIKKYPKLTEEGAWAKTGTYPMGGYYTQEDIREIVAYAAVRGVEIIPEIEFPAHVLSAIVAYPWLSCTGQQHQIPSHHFISRDLLCVGKETTFQFLEDVLDETIALFPSKYINIGGDEANYERWEKCPECRKVMEEHGFMKASQLQGYLTNRVASLLAQKGKKAVGWEEIILRGEIDTPVVSLFWHNASDTLKVKGTPHKAIMIPATHMYFDFPESATPGEVKAASWMPPISLQKTYSLPIGDYSASSDVLGVQACFWSDQFIHGDVLREIPYLDENRSENYAEYLTFPRLIALSEVAWCKSADRNFDDFTSRLAHHYSRLDYKGCNYRVPEPFYIRKMDPKGGYTYTLSQSVAGSEIRYTIDGSYPTSHSPLYEEPVFVKNKSNFRASTFVTPRHFSLPIYEKPDYEEYKQYGNHVVTWKPYTFQKKTAIWCFECSGKIISDGLYEMALVPIHGEGTVYVRKVRIYKKNEVINEFPAELRFNAKSSPVVIPFEVKGFEAGTQYFIDMEADCEGGESITGHVFLRKVISENFE